MKWHEEKRLNTEHQIENAKRILSNAGFKLTVDGCGCCDSPWVRLTYNDEEVIYDNDDGPYRARRAVYIEMHDEVEV